MTRRFWLIERQDEPDSFLSVEGTWANVSEAREFDSELDAEDHLGAVPEGTRGRTLPFTGY